MITSVSNATNGNTSTVPSKFNDLKAEDFMNIMLKELQQQDPFEPVSSKDLVSQMGQISSIQSNMQLSSTLKDLAINQKLSVAGTLLGKEVTGLNGNGDKVNGIVTAVKREGDKVFLELDSGERMSVDNVTAMVDKNPVVDTEATLDTELNAEEEENQDA
jgi:flagellar basal-body rod modification protein FlgD